MNAYKLKNLLRFQVRKKKFFSSDISPIFNCKNRNQCLVFSRTKSSFRNLKSKSEKQVYRTDKLVETLAIFTSII